MQQFLKSKEDGKLLSVTGGKVFTNPEEVIKKNITASFLTCQDLQGAEHLVYTAYTKTGTFSERNGFFLISGEEAESAAILFKDINTIRAEKDYTAQYEELASTAILNVPFSIIETTNTTQEIEEIDNDPIEHN